MRRTDEERKTEAIERVRAAKERQNTARIALDLAKEKKEDEEEKAIIKDNLGVGESGNTSANSAIAQSWDHGADVGIGEELE